MDSCETILKISSSKNTDFNIQELEDKCYASMNDDFNTPVLISHLFEGVKIINSLNDGKAKIDVDNLKKLKELFQFFIFDILGLKSRKDNRGENTTNEIMDLILKLRKKAKISKDFETADLIRDDLNNVGIEIKDGRDGSSWHAKSK
jgi:cysteinyl-tRNA synthetase